MSVVVSGVFFLVFIPNLSETNKFEHVDFEIKLKNHSSNHNNSISFISEIN